MDDQVTDLINESQDFAGDIASILVDIDRMNMGHIKLEDLDMSLIEDTLNSINIWLDEDLSSLLNQVLDRLSDFDSVRYEFEALATLLTSTQEKITEIDYYLS